MGILDRLLTRSRGPLTPLGAGMPLGDAVGDPGGLAAFGATSAYLVGPPRSTTPWQSGPRRFVGGDGGDDTTLIGRPGDFVPGEHMWGPVEGDPGFPHGSRWPGYPGGWDTPWFTRDKGRGNALTSRVSTVWSCVDLISRTLSTMPTHLARKSLPMAPLPWQTSPEPLIYPNWADFVKQVINSLLLRGNAYVVVTARYADTTPARFVCLNPDQVHSKRTGATIRYWIGDPDQGGAIPLDTDDVLHLRYQTWPGTHLGVGPLDAAGRNLSSAEAMANYASGVAGRGGIPNAVLQSKVPLTKDQAGEIKSSWRETVLASSGVDPVVLTDALTYTPLTIAPKDMALLDTRLFDEQRVCSAFGVPLWLVGLPMNDGLTYSTVDGTLLFFWRSCLRPIAHNVATALSMWALPADTFLMFDSDEFTRPPIAERAAAYKTFIEAGVMTRDEARLEEGWAPLGSDDLPQASPSLATEGLIGEGRPG